MSQIKFKKSTLKQSKLVFNSENLYYHFIDKKHILFRIHSEFDFSIFLKDFEKYYSKIGQHGYNSILLLKSLLLLELENINSNKELVKQIKVNLQYCHFLDLAVDDEIFDHSVLSNFRKKLGDGILETIFDKFVSLLKTQGLISNSDERYIDAVQHIADVSIVSINNLLGKSLNDLYTLIKQINSVVS